MHQIEKETRRDRWYGLPYGLMAVMVLTGALSYFLDYRYRQVNAVQPLQTASAKADEYIKKRIAEHDQAAKQAVAANTVKTPTQPVAKSAAPLKITKPATSQSRAGVFSKARFGTLLSFLKRIPRTWMIGGTFSGAFLILVVLAFRRKKSSEADLETSSTVEDKSVAIATPVQSKSTPVEENGLFSHYLGNDAPEEGSFVETYLKPTFSSFGDSVKAFFSKITKRSESIEEPMQILSSAMIAPMSHPLPQPANVTGNLFRRAVLVKK